MNQKEMNSLTVYKDPYFFGKAGQVIVRNDSYDDKQLVGGINPSEKY